MSAHKNYGRAASYALIGFTGWTLSDALLKLVRTDGVPHGEILLISGLSGMVVIGAIAAARGKARAKDISLSKIIAAVTLLSNKEG